MKQKKSEELELVQKGRFSKDVYSDEELAELTEEEKLALDEADDIEDDPPQIVESLEIEKHLNKEFNELATEVRDRLWKAVEFAGGGKDKDNQGIHELEFKVKQLIMGVRCGTAGNWKEGLEIAIDTKETIDELMAGMDEFEALEILLPSRFAAAAEFDMGLKTIHKSLFQRDTREVKEERDERKRAVTIPEEYWEEAEEE